MEIIALFLIEEKFYLWGEALNLAAFIPTGSSLGRKTVLSTAV